MTKKDKIFVVGVLIVFAVAFYFIGRQTARLGGFVEPLQTTFSSGITLGDEEQAPCFKIMDTDRGGYTYVTALDGVLTATGGAAGTFTIPSACGGK